ncbi:MAG: 30S ribosomal protein S12 methylthiotransferase RimO [Vampirovibrionales bacterium]
MPTATPETVKPLNISFVHLGCPKNLVDTETMLGSLEQDGHTIVADETDADMVLVNTCAFIEEAQKESVQTLVRLAEGGKRLLISGCLAQKFQGELLDLFPEADAVVGTHQVADVASVVRKIQQGERVLAIQQDPTYLLQDDSHRRHVTMGASVYVKVSEGCDYRCKFCIIPSMRGNLRSRTVESIEASVKELVNKGVSEIVLIGQDNTSYGRDIDTDLPTLLKTLNQIEGMKWLRFLYAYPNNRLNQELLDTIRESQHIVKYLDCPLQHTHPDMLKRMNRPIIDTVEWAKWVRASIPGVKLRTTFIVGFPGETEEEFQHLKETVSQVEWDRLGVFEYSDVDTAASTDLPDKVPADVKKRRRHEIMEIQQKISYRKNQAMLGQVIPVVIDEIRASGLIVGRSQWDSPEIDNQVLIKQSSQNIIPGDLVAVKIGQVTPYDLKGEIVSLWDDALSPTLLKV